MAPAIKIEIRDDEDLGYEPIQSRKLFIGGLLSKTDEFSLSTYFQKWGEIEDLIIVRDRFTSISRLFGFITYKHTYMIDNVQKARPHIVDGHMVQTKRAIPRYLLKAPNANAAVKRLYVANLDPIHDEKCLRKYFKMYGRVLNVEFPLDRQTGQRRHFAFIDFEDYDTVDKILLRRTHVVKNVPLEVRKAFSSETRQRNNWCDCCKQNCSNNVHNSPRLSNQNIGNNLRNNWNNQGNSLNLPSLLNNNYNNNNSNWGNGYQQSFGGGPQRIGWNNNRRIPF